MILKDINEMFADDLRDPIYAAGYLNIALEEEGIEGFLYALQKVARAHGVSTVAAHSDIPRESLYRSLSEKGNPGIKPLTRILDALGLHITIASRPSQTRPIEQQEHQKDSESNSLHRRLTEDVAALCNETRAEQETLRRAALQTQEETRQMLGQIQQLATALTDLVRQAEGHIGHNQPRLVSHEPTTTYTFPTKAKKPHTVSTEPYQQNPLQLVRVAS